MQDGFLSSRLSIDVMSLEVGSISQPHFTFTLVTTPLLRLLGL